MAKFILGGIVTNIAGSVGGTTLRRVPNGFSMYNKIKGTGLSKLLANTRVPQIASIFQRWAVLGGVEQSAWNAQALLVTFPDKFGVPKNLTGRQLFTKANIQGLPNNLTVNSAVGFTTATIPFTLDSFDFTISEELFPVIFSVFTEGTPIMFSAEVSNNNIYQPTFKSRKVFYVGAIDAGGVVQIRTPFLNAFPYISTGYKVALYAQTINDFGMVSPYQCYIGQVD